MFQISMGLLHSELNLNVIKLFVHDHIHLGLIESGSGHAIPEHGVTYGD